VCLAIPGQVVEFVPEQPALVKVDVAGVRRNVNIGLLEDGELALGDWVLIHVGFALSKVSETEAAGQLLRRRAMGEAELAMEEVRGYTLAADDGERR
jgi:hydrogenase expression/formation protein HypC